MALELPNITSHGGDAYAESNLDLGVKFNLTLEIYTLIYYDAYFGCSLEGLGNIMMHAMVEIPVSPPLEQML